MQNGVIVHSDLLLEYLAQRWPGLYFVSSTTKVLTDFRELKSELDRADFRYVVPDFRLNRQFDALSALTQAQKDKVEFLCNECCWFGCTDRKRCYETVSRMNLGEACPEHRCAAPDAALHDPARISAERPRGDLSGQHARPVLTKRREFPCCKKSTAC